MQNPIEFKITGLKELQDSLQELELTTAKAVLRDALKIAANRLRDMFAALAPRDTGLLANNFNIKTKTVKDSIAARAMVGPSGKVQYPNPSARWQLAFLGPRLAMWKNAGWSQPSR